MDSGLSIKTQATIPSNVAPKTSDSSNGSSNALSKYLSGNNVSDLGAANIKPISSSDLNTKGLDDYSQDKLSGLTSDVIRESNPLTNTFDISNWGIKDFLNERGSFQKRLDTLLGDPTWFYFKIFFKFDTGYGLFGQVLNNQGSYYSSSNHYKGFNTARNYFQRIKDRYEQEKPEVRLAALNKFVKSLSFISCNAPWTFSSIKDLDSTLKYDLNRPKEKRSITIEMLQEAVDMRLSSLFDLYRFVAFDYAHDKEVLPENLRKFDMDIVLFQVPIRYFQTSIKDMKNRTVNYKSLYGGTNTDWADKMSFHLFTLQNCEFDVSSFSSLIPSQISNEKPFELKPSVRIHYDKAYHHSLNEWIHVLVGDSDYKNFNSEASSTEKKRIDILKYGVDNPLSGNYASNNYKAVVEASEDLITNAMRVVAPSVALGNIYRGAQWSDMYKVGLDSMKQTWNNLKDSFVTPINAAFPSHSTTKDYNGFYYANNH